MNRLLLLIALLGCTPSSTPVSGTSSPVHKVELAAQAWRAEPTDDSLKAVSLAAAEALEQPPTERDRAVGLAGVLTDVLLRPDLARPLLEPHRTELSAEQQGVWLNTLLRSNDVETFASEVRRLHGISPPAGQSALLSAAAQAKIHRQVDWEQAVYAWKAGSLIDRLPERGRRTLDHPFSDFADAIELLIDLLPDHTFKFALARTTRQDEPVPGLEAGAVPAMKGRRRVIGYVESSDREAVRELAERATLPRHKHTVSFSVLLTGPDERETHLCGEGRIEKGVYWSISACDPTRQARWMQAAAFDTELRKMNVNRADRLEKIRERFPDAPFGS